MTPGLSERITKADVVNRFNANIVENVEGCWIWMLSVNHQGYGLFWVDGQYVATHRWSYEHFIKPIPEGLQIDHLCRRRDCVNPSHLEPVTARENRRRSMKDHCAHGHRWTTATTYMDKRGQRNCIPCHRLLTKQWKEKRRACSLVCVNE